jgi:hypothetical protein
LFVQAAAKISGTGFCGTVPRHHNNVYAREIPMPERLSNESFESIAIHRSSNTLFGHRQSEPREINVIFSVQNCPVAITYPVI